MKYMVSWFERSQGSPMEYENAQKRILEVFTQWKAPDNFKIELFVIRVGDWGGYMLLDCDDPLEVHKFCSMLPAFEFEARPVVPVMDAGASDSKYLRIAGIPTYGVPGMFTDVDDNRAHGKDERLRVKDFYDGLDFYYQFIKTLGN